MGQIARGIKILRICLDRRGLDPFCVLIQSVALCMVHTQMRQANDTGLRSILNNGDVMEKILK